MTRALAVLLLLLAAAPAEARHAAPWSRWHRAWWAQDGRTFGVPAWACDRVSGRCVQAIRYFRNPVWR